MDAVRTAVSGNLAIINALNPAQCSFYLCNTVTSDRGHNEPQAEVQIWLELDNLNPAELSCSRERTSAPSFLHLFQF